MSRDRLIPYRDVISQCFREYHVSAMKEQEETREKEEARGGIGRRRSNPEVSYLLFIIVSVTFAIIWNYFMHAN